MSYMKRTMALLLALTMSLCLVFSASAATSPVTAPTNPSFNPATSQDINSADHDNAAVVVSTVGSTVAGVNSVASAGATSVDLSIARDASNAIVPISQIGNGYESVFGPEITTVNIGTDAPEIVITANSFGKNNNVKNINFWGKGNLRIKKNAFRATKYKKKTIRLIGIKSASQVKVGKGSFKGLTKKAKISVTKELSASEFKTLKAKLKNAGFKGKIVRE